jgi:hypothetical protein
MVLVLNDKDPVLLGVQTETGFIVAKDMKKEVGADGRVFMQHIPEAWGFDKDDIFCEGGAK